VVVVVATTAVAVATTPYGGVRVDGHTRARMWTTGVRTSKDSTRKNGEVTSLWARCTQQERELRK